MILCFIWVIGSPNQVLIKDTRIFFYVTGTLCANLSCRLIVRYCMHEFYFKLVFYIGIRGILILRGTNINHFLLIRDNYAGGIVLKFDTFSEKF